MDSVEIETSITLSRTAAGAVTFGRAVERYADKEYTVYGGARSLDDGSGAWAPEENVIRTNPAGEFDTSMIKLAVAGAFTTGVIGSLDIASLDLSEDGGMNILIKPSIAVAAGVLQVAVSETIALGGSPVTMDLPAMEAGKWHYFSLAYTGVASDRDAVLSFGLIAASDPGIVDLDVQSVRSGAKSYGIAGFLNDDQAVEGDVSAQYQDSVILAAGNMNPKLASGITCVAEQPLYAVPGTGELHTLEIVSDNRPITATEDNSNAGTQVGVRF